MADSGGTTGSDSPIELTLEPPTIVLQPTPLCNLRCTYCYLPDVSVRHRMDPAIPRLLADQLAASAGEHRTELRWHAGEPLTVGIDHFTRLVEPFDRLRRAGRVRHSLQTNATLIDGRWCEFFRAHDVAVGVSIDGPRWANRQRRTLSSAETFDRARRGIARLADHGVPFTVIAVVSVAHMPRIVEQVDEYLGFFDSLGARSVGFSVEETEGRHVVDSGLLDADSAVAAFWQALLSAWRRADCRPVVREFSGVLRFAAASLAGHHDVAAVDLLPAVTWDGDVVVLSPELAGYRDARYGDFTAGNLYREPLAEIVRRAPQLRYVQEFLEGAGECRQSCRYFAYCRAGQASNRYFEHGDFTGTVTRFCRHMRQLPFDAVVGVGTRDSDRSETCSSSSNRSTS